jgi:hypothetical protein
MQQKPRWLHCNESPISHFANPFLTEWSNVSKNYMQSQLAMDHWANGSDCPVSNITMETLMPASLYSSRRLGKNGQNGIVGMKNSGNTKHSMGIVWCLEQKSLNV